MSSPLALSFRVALLAMLVVVPLGAWLGYWLARSPSRVRKPMVDALILLPMVLPPTVTGYALLLLFGRRGPIGGLLERLFGVRMVFHLSGAVLAAIVVALPLMAKGAETAFSRVDRELEDITRVHGARPSQVFREVTLPLSRAGLAIAATLASLRALGEFGATLLFAGYVPGVTATAPMEIFFSLQSGDDARARTLVLALAGVSLFATVTLGVWTRRTPS